MLGVDKGFLELESVGAIGFFVLMFYVRAD